MKILGLMSGTSLDGLDMALCKFEPEQGSKWRFDVIKAITEAYDDKMQSFLRRTYNTPIDQLSSFDTAYAKWMGDRVNAFLKGTDQKIDLIASHGHTVYHQPEKGITYQLGNGKVLANLCNTTVVCDFRRQDVLLGGQGAPLVPVGDALLFGQYRYCLNLGGIANISFDYNGKRHAYDVCPVNLVLNTLAERLGFQFDEDGIIASRGRLIHDLLQKLNELPYYERSAPKSLSREWVAANIEAIIDNTQGTGINTEDLLHTFCRHIAFQIARCIKRGTEDKVLVTGGGACNKFLMDCLKKDCAAKIIVPNEQIVSYKEAIIFAFLGLLRVREINNCWASVTGASRDSCGGSIVLPKLSGG